MGVNLLRYDSSLRSLVAPPHLEGGDLELRKIIGVGLRIEIENLLLCFPWARDPAGWPILTISHDYSRFLTISHDFSRLLTISHDSSRFLTIPHDSSRFLTIPHDPLLFS